MSEINNTVVDADHPRLLGIQTLFQHLHQAWERLEPGSDAINDAHGSLLAKVHGENLTVEDLEILERQSHEFMAQLLDASAAIRKEPDTIGELQATLVVQEGRIDEAEEKVRHYRRRTRTLEDDLRDLRQTVRELKNSLRNHREPIGEVPPQRSHQGSEAVFPRSEAGSHRPSTIARPPRLHSPEPPADYRRFDPFKSKEPGVFSGTDPEVEFQRWWEEIRDFIDINTDGRPRHDAKLKVWLNGYLKGDAKEWFHTWKTQNEGASWDQLSVDIVGRFRDDREDVRALHALETLHYPGSGTTMHAFLTRWDNLCAKAHIQGLIYRNMLLNAVGHKVRTRVQNAGGPAKDDAALRRKVLEQGNAEEDWEANSRARQPNLPIRQRDQVPTRTRDRDQGARPNPPQQPPVRPTASGGHRTYPPTGTPRRYERKFNSVEDATEGIPPDVVIARRTSGACLRCGKPKGSPGKHRAQYCHRPANHSAHQVSAIGKRPGDDDVSEEGRRKQPRLEVAAVDRLGEEDTPFYDAEEAGYDSEVDRWED
jgi:hypothetical protein